MNFIARHAGPNFHTAMHAIRPYLKPGAVFPMDEAALKAVEVVKRLIQEAHTLFKLDEDAARSGEDR